jgi:hypothetical protein
MSDGDTEMNLADGKYEANKTLHRTPIPLRSIAAGELGRWVAKQTSGVL